MGGQAEDRGSSQQAGHTQGWHLTGFSFLLRCSCQACFQPSGRQGGPRSGCARGRSLCRPLLEGLPKAQSSSSLSFLIRPND